MDKHDEFKDLSPRQLSKSTTPLFAPQSTITIYTTLSILLVMKKNLGMEAMLEYMDQYLALIDKHNPKFKFAVRKALSYMNVEKMYKDAMQCE